MHHAQSISAEEARDMPPDEPRHLRLSRQDPEPRRAEVQHMLCQQAMGLSSLFSLRVVRISTDAVGPDAKASWYRYRDALHRDNREPYREVQHQEGATGRRPLLTA